jgi:hypothetical protein
VSTVFCRYHCVACGSHFASLEAFDLHRDGDHAGKRYCLVPDDCERLAVASSAGVCRLTNPPAELKGVVIYTSARHAADRENAVQRLRGGERAAEGPSGDLGLGVAA